MKLTTKAANFFKSRARDTLLRHVYIPNLGKIFCFKVPHPTTTPMGA